MSVRLSATHVKNALRDVAEGGRTYDLIDSQQPGLLLRVGPRGARWAFKAIRFKQTIRLTIGSPPEISLDDARTIAAAAQRGIVNRLWAPDDRFLEAELIKLGKVAPRPAPPPRDPAHVAEYENSVQDLPYWTWEQAREAFLAEVKRTRRPDTHLDYTKKLGVAELAKLQGKKARRITLEDLAEAVYEIHVSGRETHAHNVTAVIRPMFKWLGLAHVRGRSGVGVDGIGVDATKLKAPEKSAGVKPRANGKIPGRYVPPAAEVGTILGIARAGVLDHTVALSLELLALTAQRRRAIADAQVDDFVPWIEMPGWGVWSMGPRHRKTADKMSDQHRHVVPLAPVLWSRLVPHLTRCQQQGTPFLFPQIRAWKLGDPLDGHMSDSAINHRLLDIGVRASPHDVRRAFSTYCQKLFRFSRPDVKLVMDHSEGIASSDVLEGHYTVDDRMDLKEPIVARWTAWCDEQAAAAAAGFPPLPELAVQIAERRRIREREGQAKTAAKKKAEAERKAAEEGEDLKRLVEAAVKAAA